MTSSFISPKKFFDEKTFQRGFSRSGHFTIKESAILENHGYAFKDLAEGKSEPKNQEEKDFVAVIKGTKVAETIYEKTWMKYHDLLTNKPRVYTLPAVDFGSEEETV